MEHGAAQQLTAAEELTGHVEPAHEGFVGFPCGALDLNELGLAGGAACGLCAAGNCQTVGRHLFGVCTQAIQQLLFGEAGVAFGQIGVAYQNLRLCHVGKYFDFFVGGAGSYGHVASAVLPSCVCAQDVADGVGQANHNGGLIGNAVFLEQPCQLVGLYVQIPPSDGLYAGVIFIDFNNGDFVGLGVCDGFDLATGGNKSGFKLNGALVIDVEVTQILYVGAHGDFLFHMFGKPLYLS